MNAYGESPRSRKSKRLGARILEVTREIGILLLVASLILEWRLSDVD